jgi:hypothetical protein
MPISTVYKALQQISLNEFSDIVVQAQVMTLPTGDPLKLRLDVVDGSMLDVFISASGRYSYHWDRRLTAAGDLYRHDNAPHNRWHAVSTFPKHFHDGNESAVIESRISDDPEQALREFLAFVRRRLLTRP